FIFSKKYSRFVLQETKTSHSREKLHMLMDNVQSFVAPDAAGSGLQWQIETAPVAYDRALAFMEARARTIRERNHDEMVWLLEHPPVYTAGTSAELKDLINPKFP